MSVTLEQVLASRDERMALQKELLSQNPGKTLLCFTVVMPGNEKRNTSSLIIAQAGLSAIRAVFGDEFAAVRDLQTGFEAYLLTDMNPVEVKLSCVQIEESHPLGRLFDIDVIDPSGLQVQRSEPRKCLLCDNEARFCMRNHTHSLDEMLAKINEMVQEYVQ